MGIRHWLRKKRAEQADEDEEDRAPSVSIINSIFGREPPTLHALGEYDQKTYPGELQDLLRRREDVAEELREMDLTTRVARVEAIPRLQQMLRTYPHPLAYETLIHAYVDAGRWDEARGAAFAARERRTQVLRSPYSEIRAEVDRLKEWTPEEVDVVRREREGVVPPVQPTRPTEPARADEPASSPRPAPVAVGAGAAAVQPTEIVVPAPDGDSGQASVTAEPAATESDPEPASVASDPEPASIASATEPASIASDAEPASVAAAEPVAVLDGESTEAAEDAESVDTVGFAETDETGSEEDAESANADAPGGGATAAGGNGGGASRRGGKGPRSQRKGKRRR
jgi:hypothetical protein